LSGLPVWTFNVLGDTGDVNDDGKEDDDDEKVVGEMTESVEAVAADCLSWAGDVCELQRTLATKASDVEAEKVELDWVDFPMAGVGLHLSEIGCEHSLTFID